MATSKDKKANKGTTDFSFSSPVRNPVVPMANDPDTNEPHIPWTTLITLLVLCLVLVIALPVMGIMYMDMNNATNAAVYEIKKMRELRAKMIIEMRGE